MKKSFRIPTILGLAFLTTGVILGIVLVERGSTILSRANPATTPKQIKITNVKHDSFTVSWITDGETTGFVKYGPDEGISQLASDDRDQISGKVGNFLTHHVTVRGLNPSTTYFFKVSSAGQLFDNNGQLYQINTAPALTESPPPSDVAYGIILKPDGSPAEGTIVYLSLSNTTPLSTLSSSSGNWVIPLNLARAIDLSGYASYDLQASIEEIAATNGHDGTATAVTTTKNDSPVPTITLGKRYDFRATSQETTESADLLSVSPSPASQFSPASPIPNQKNLEIINPRPGEQLNTGKPEFFGTGPAGETLLIEIHSPTPSSGTIKIDSQGNWRWTPPSNLEPGEHSITVSLPNGIKKTISFVVIAAGTSDIPALTATISGTLQPTSSPAPTMTPTPRPSPTPWPTPTTTVTSPPRVSLPSTSGGTPTSGDLTITFITFIMGIILIISGFLIRSIII